MHSFIIVTLVFSLACLIMLVAHQTMLRKLGATTTYNFWSLTLLAPALTIAAPFIEHLLAQAFRILEVQAPPLLVLTFTKNWQAPTANDLTVSIISAVVLTGVTAMLGMLLFDLIRQHQRQAKTFYIGRVRAQRSPAGSSAGITGIFRPTLLLPTDFAHRFEREERHLILQHEFRHWQRGDTRINALAWLVLSAQWFNPIAWQAYRRFRADQELACDADVLIHTPRSQKSYATALLKSSHSQLFHSEMSPCSTQYGNTKGSYKMLKERLTSLQNRTRTKRSPLIASAATLLLVSLVWNVPAQSQSTWATEDQKVEPGTIIVQISPRYPETAAKQGIEGYVDVSFVVNNDGKVDNLEVVDAEPKGIFEEEVVAAVKRWRFVPADNKEMQIRVEMKLDD